ncbi:MAG: hypothetical protein KC485_02590 [Gemmatimonadetes bacterium]|nr:hypothetical protein [Gemmatimonadota bacterium]
MRTRFVLPAALLALAACSSDPTGPGGGGGGPESWDLELSVSSIIVREMCEGFPVDIDGGEWSHRLTSRFPGSTSITMGATNGYPNANSIRNAGRGGSLALSSTDKDVRRTVTGSKSGDVVTLTIQATEWDYDIFGNNPRADDRMDDESATATIRYADGAWPNIPDGVLTVQSGSSCRVDVNYSFEAVKN